MRSGNERTNLRKDRTFVVLTASFRTHTLGLRNEATARCAEARSSVVQHALPPPRVTPDHDHTLGIPTHATQPLLQTDVFKELVNKFAWALGSTYRLTYAGKRSNVRIAAQQLATSIIQAEGYPHSIAK